MAVHRLLALACLLVLGAAEKDNIAKLTKFNFENNVKKGSWFVKFYAPWCTHCQRMAPTWEQLADKAVAEDWPVRIADVDCTTSKDICDKLNVNAFPTLMLIGDGELQGKYQGEPSLDGFGTWLNKQLPGGRAAKPSSGEKVVKGPDAAGSGTTTSVFSALGMVVRNSLGRFPTSSKVANLYIYGGSMLALLVAGLCSVFKALDAEEAAAIEREKEE